MTTTLKSLILFGFILITLGIFFSFSNILLSPTITEKDISQVCFGQPPATGGCFFVETAKTPAERENGLMFRESLSRDSGMFFIFEKTGIYSMWMKNMLIPLDIIWLDENNKVVFIKQNALPCTDSECESIKPAEQALYALEINAGLAQELRINVGDSAAFVY